MIPVAIAPTGPRVSESVVSIARPPSSKPMTWEVGTKTSSQRTSTAGDSRCPILRSVRPIDSPAASPGTRKAPIVSSGRLTSSNAVTTW